MASQQTEQTQEQQETPPQDEAVPESADAQTPPQDVPAPDTAPEVAPQAGDGVEAASGFQASDILDKVKDAALKIWAQIVEWLTSPAFLVMGIS